MKSKKWWVSFVYSIPSGFCFGNNVMVYKKAQPLSGQLITIMADILKQGLQCDKITLLSFIPLGEDKKKHLTNAKKCGIL